jgi:hypothetical protein
MSAEATPQLSLDELDRAHRELMAGYAYVLDPRIGRGTESTVAPSPRFGTTGSLVRYFARSHARRQLRELGATYAQLQHSAERQGTAAEEERAWLRPARDDAMDFADTLSPPDWTWDVLLGVAPPSALVSVLLFVFGLQNPSFVVVLLLMLCGAATAGAILMVQEAFKAKRSLFKGLDSGWSLYEAEDRLYELLNRHKRREFPFDLALLLVTCIAASVAMGASVVALLLRDDVEGRTEGVVLSGLLAVGAVVVAVTTSRRAVRRSPS